MKQVAVMQPYFLPYLGYFQLIDSVEQFIFFDKVQYQRKSWMGRNRLLNIDKGEPFFIRPGIEKPAYKEALPNVQMQSDNAWKDKLIAQLKNYKNKAHHFYQVLSLVEDLLTPQYTTLVECNMETTKKLAVHLGIETRIDKYTDYSINLEASETDKGDWGRIIANHVDATHYINAPGGEAFIFADGFSELNMKLGFIQPTLSPYNQKDLPFIAGLSIIDVLMFNGLEKTKDMIKEYTIKWKN